MKRALVIGASGGIGSAVSAALVARDFDVKGLGRADGLDVTDPDKVDQVLGALDGAFDLVFVAIGVLGRPEKTLAAIKQHGMEEVFAVNTIGLGLILAHLPRLLAKEGRCGVLTARVGSIGDNRIGGWHTYRASKAAANMLVRGAAIEMARTHKGATVVALHPGTVETPFTADYKGRHTMMPAAEAAGRLLDVLTGLSPDQTGQFYDYEGKKVPW